MTPTQTITILRQHNAWRLGDEDLPQHAPKQITEAIDAAVEMIERLEALQKEIDHIKEVQFALKVKAVADGWRGKCERLEKERDELRVDLLKQQSLTDAAQQLAETAQRRADKRSARAEAAEKERDALRAKVEEMEKQMPAATVIKKGADRYWMSERLGSLPDGTYPFYALPGAQGEEK